MAWLLYRFGLWLPSRSFMSRLARVGLASLIMSLGLWVVKGLAPQAGPLSLAAFCLGGLALYALAAWMTGAVTRDDWAALMKIS
jgi:putative peptidoglycan lipid II flippase